MIRRLSGAVLLGKNETDSKDEAHTDSLEVTTLWLRFLNGLASLKVLPTTCQQLFETYLIFRRTAD